VCEAIVQMKSDHLIELKQSNMFVNECMIEPTPTRPTGHPRTAGAGVFDRLLGNSAPVKPQHAEPVPTRKEDTTAGNTPPSVKTRSANEEDHILRLLRN
jgi:hypothetical protein